MSQTANTYRCRIAKLSGVYVIQINDGEGWANASAGCDLKRDAQARIDAYRACGYFPAEMVQVVL